jgi:hypothetical protein
VLGKEIFVEAVIEEIFFVENSVPEKEGGSIKLRKLFEVFYVSSIESLKRRFTLFRYQLLRCNIALVVVVSDIKASNLQEIM